MDGLGVKERATRKKSNGKRRNNKKEDIKVVYISSPIKVKTSASEFRSLVQELTGKDSDIAYSQHVNEQDYHKASCSVDGRPENQRKGNENDEFEPLDLDHTEESFLDMVLSNSSFFNEAYAYGLST